MAFEDDDGLESSAITRVHFALLHLRAARFFAKRTEDLEKAQAGEMLGEFWDEIFYHASATVFSTISGLEAYANECFLTDDHYEKMPRAAKKVARERFFGKEYSLLSKFKELVKLRGFGELDTGRAPYQSVTILIEIRNALVHFKPEWTATRAEYGQPISAAPDESNHDMLSKKLGQAGIQPSPFFGVSEPLFPRGWASASCTSWVVRSASAMIEDFEQRTNRVVLSGRF